MRGGRIRLAVLGDPLAYTLSPVLHRAGLEAATRDGDSQAIPTPVELLGARLGELAGRGFRGVNLTAPLKEEALAHLDRVSEPARRARSVNTVGFERDGWWGETTDGAGFLDWIGTLGREVGALRAVLLGAGGAARSLALALVEAGCREVTVSARRPAEAAAGFADIPGPSLVAWGSVDESRRLGEATLVVNATPLSGALGPTPLERVRRAALVIDLCYGPRPTRWVMAARAAGLESYDGLGLLLFQARRSLSLWIGSPVPVDSLARAVGWPR